MRYPASGVSVRLRPTVLLCAALMVGTGSAMAQERATVESLDQRLQRVERVLDQSLINVVQQINALQQELRELRGEIENLNYELENQRRRGRDLYSDTDKRLTELEQSTRRLPVGIGGEVLIEGDVDPDIDGLSTDSLPPEGSALNEDSLDETDAAAVIVDPASAGASGSGSGVASDNVRRKATAAEQESYTTAYDLLAAGDNDASGEAFERFLEEYPDGPYSDNAWYWLGEAQYAQRRFDVALDSFGEVISRFPSSPKVPDARLKIGFALFEQSEFGNARAVLVGVQNDYSGRSVSTLARKRLQQMDRDGL